MARSLAHDGTCETKPSAWERAVAKFGNYFQEKGLGPEDLPAAIIIHEVLGITVATLAWAACYHLRPSTLVARWVSTSLQDSQRAATAQKAYSLAMTRASATVKKLSWMQRAPGVDPARLTTSLAESLVFRATAKPATFVFKLWASYKLVILRKHAMAQRAVLAAKKS